MKIDVTQGLMGVNGEPLKNEDQSPATVRDLCVNALMTMIPKVDEGLTGKEKLEYHSLAVRIQNEDAPDLTPENLSLLKERTGKMYSPAAVGPLYEIFNA